MVVGPGTGLQCGASSRYGRCMRIGVVGLGGIAQAHLAGWRALCPAEPIEFHGYDPGEQVVTPDGVERHADLAGLLAEVDLVDICTPTFSHVELIKAAADAGKPVICEKPLALTVADAIDAARHCADAGVSLQVGQVVRFFPAYEAAHRAFSTGSYGEPAVLRFRRAGGMPRQAWFADEERSGGIALDLMIHDIDQARWFAGDVVRVHAHLRGLDGPGQRPHALAILTHESGAISHITSSWALAHGWGTSFEIACTEGMLEYDSREAPALRLDRTDLRLPPPSVTTRQDPFAAELGELAGAALEGRPARVGAGDAIAALAVACAARESARTGRAVVPDPVPDDLRSPRVSWSDLAGVN